MERPVAVGLDFGSLGLRAAWACAGSVALAPEEAGWRDADRWLVCAPAPGATLGVAFSPVKELIGAPGAAALAEALVAIRRKAGGAERVVISVPALYSSARRTALRSLALAAGFAEADLLNDCMAAAIWHTARSAESRTLLVFLMGYHGFEVALIRKAGSRYRALAYHGGVSAGGAAFDSVLVDGCVAALVARDWWPAGAALEEAEARDWRRAAQSIKESFLERAQVELDVRRGRPPHEAVAQLAVSRVQFQRIAAGLLSRALDRACEAMAEANLQISDIDEVVAAGGSTRLEFVIPMLKERFGRTPALVAGEALACGAAWFGHPSAALAPGEPLPAPAESESPERPPQIPVALTLPGESTAAVAGGRADASAARLVVRVPAGFSPQAGALRGQVAEFSRALLRRGAEAEAEAFLQALIEDSQALLATLRQPQADRAHQVAERALERARQHLEGGRYEEAVQQAHQAYSLEPDAPAVFRQMIEIHRRAAAAFESVEGYEQSLKWLQCAHSHDSTNAGISDEIAQRHFRHAQQMAARRQEREALQALEECLCYNPEHTEAQALRQGLRLRAVCPRE